MEFFLCGLSPRSSVNTDAIFCVNRVLAQSTSRERGWWGGSRKVAGRSPYLHTPARIRTWFRRYRHIVYTPSLKLLGPWPDAYHVTKSSTTRTITKAYLACNRRLKLLAIWYTPVHIAKSYTTPTFTPDARKSVGSLWSVYGLFMARLWCAYRGFRAPRESSRYPHAQAAQILLFRSDSRAIALLECIVHRLKTDIPGMLTPVSEWRINLRM